MGILRRVVTAGRRMAGFILGPRRDVRELARAVDAGEAVPSRHVNSAIEQWVGDEAAPWWLAPARKLWAALLGSILMGIHARFGWDLTGLEDQIEQFIWTPLIGWLVWRVSNRAS